VTEPPIRPTSHRLVFVLHRRPEMSREEFQRYWSVTHAPLVRSVADVLGITGYQQVHTVRDDPTRSAPSFDGVAELWFDAARTTASRDEQRAAAALLLEDEARFIDLAASPIWLAEERVMCDGPKEGLRTTSAVRRKAGTTRDEFRRHWVEVHAPLALAHPEVFGITRYVQLSAPDDAESYPPATTRGAPPPFDGLAEVYTESVQPDPEAAAPIYAALVADTESFVDRDHSPNCLGRVDVIVDR
jgi:uncharacterized protein (TIGR02118 family)